MPSDNQAEAVDVQITPDPSLSQLLITFTFPKGMRQPETIRLNFPLARELQYAIGRNLPSSPPQTD